MSEQRFKIKDLKGINGYQFLQVMYFLLRSAYYTPEVNPDCGKIDEFFKKVGSLEGKDLDDICLKIATLGADISKDYWNIIFSCVETDGRDTIPESIQTFPVEDLVYIISEGLKKVLAIKLPF